MLRHPQPTMKTKLTGKQVTRPASTWYVIIIWHGLELDCMVTFFSDSRWKTDCTAAQGKGSKRSDGWPLEVVRRQSGRHCPKESHPPSRPQIKWCFAIYIYEHEEKSHQSAQLSRRDGLQVQKERHRWSWASVWRFTNQDEAIHFGKVYKSEWDGSCKGSLLLVTSPMNFLLILNVL